MTDGTTQGYEAQYNAEHEAKYRAQEIVDGETEQHVSENKEGKEGQKSEKVRVDTTQIKKEEEESYKFGAQIDSLMNTLVNSVYSNDDYFLRELVSNANDANDKRKRMTHARGQAVDEELCIRIVPNKEERTITITDNGIGMTKADMVNYLGSIARSGTKEFRKKLEEAQGGDIDALIGKFGLGFYSAFLVADKIEVISKHEDDEAYLWSSEGPEKYVIAPYNKEIGQGTTIVLHLREKKEDYTEQKKLEDIVKVHLAFIEYPIYLWVQTEKTRKNEKDEEEKYTEEEYKQLNAEKPLWVKDPKETPISDEEYERFYKALTNDWEKHTAVSHSYMEGDINLHVLLYIQKRAPFAMFEEKKKKTNIKLYVQNVLVTSDLSEIVPEWMSFVHGVVSSRDIPMNISREIVHDKVVMKTIKKAITKKVIDMMKDLERDTEEYAKFYKEFAQCIKLGIYQDKAGAADKLIKLLRYETTKSEGKLVSLEEYTKRMAPGQEQIYVITGMKIEELKSSPFLEKMQKYEVLYMTDPVDEFVIQTMPKYEEHEIQRITSDGLKLPEEQKDMKETEEAYKAFTDAAKAAIGNSVESIVLSPLLQESPCMIKSAKYSYSPTMEHIMRAQPGAENNVMYNGGYFTKKIMEINPAHPIIQGLKKKLEEGKKEEFEQNMKLVYDTSMMACGYPLNNTTDFAQKVFQYIKGEMIKEEERTV